MGQPTPRRGLARDRVGGLVCGICYHRQTLMGGSYDTAGRHAIARAIDAGATQPDFNNSPDRIADIAFPVATPHPAPSGAALPFHAPLDLAFLRAANIARHSVDDLGGKIGPREIKAKI